MCRKQARIYLGTILILFFASNKSLAQCTWSNFFFDSFEYTNVIPHIIPGATYQNTPQTFPGCIHSGSRGLYLNIADGYIGMLYDQPFDDLCIGATYRFSMWTRDAWSSSNNFTFQVLSSTNQILATQTIITNSTWVNINMPAFIATTSSIRFQIITNTVGGPGNDGAVDDLALSICSPDPVNYNLSQCAGPGSINLYPLLNNPVLSQSGNWTGPTALSNGFQGTFTPNSNTNGLYQYTVAGILNCPDSIANLNVQLISNPSIDPLGPINACNFYILPAITGTNLSNNAAHFTAPNGGGTSFLAGAVINASQTLYMYAGSSGCSDEEILQVNINTPGNAGSDNGASFCGEGATINLTSFLSAGATLGGTWTETSAPASGALDFATGIWNSNGVNSGNYTFQYTVPSVQNCISDFANFTIAIGNVPSVEIGNDTTLCTGQSFVLNAGIGYDAYLWNNGSTSSTLAVNAPGTYYVNVSTLGANQIVNGDFELGNTGFSTDYNPGSGGSFGLLSLEGTYAVSNSPSSVHNNFSFCNDNTAAPGVNQLVVNGSSIPNQNIWCQSIPVQQNTTYEFGAWVSSVVNDPNLGQLQFSINNVPLGAIYSPSGAPCVWSQFTENWMSGLSTNAQICITSQSLAISGNDFALDDITFRPICESQDTIVVQFGTSPLVNLGADQILCSGQNVTLDAQNVGSTYLWNITETNQTIDVTTSGSYSVTVTNLQNCSATDNITITFQNIQLTGNDSIVIICSTQTQFDLFSMLQNGATLGGFWSSTTPSFGGVLNPNGTLDLTGQVGNFSFEYVVNSPFCPNDTAVMSILINQQPVAAIDQSLNLCNTVGQIVNFSSYLNNPSEPIAGSWIVPASIPPTSFNPSTNELNVSNLSQGNYIFEYVLPSPIGCVQDQMFVNITITEVPVIVFDADFIEGCAPLEVNFINQSNALGSLTYLWDLGDGVTSSNSTTVSNVYESQQCYDVSLTITANGLCTNTLVLSDMICVYAVPTASFTYNPTEIYSEDPSIEIVNTSTNNDFNSWSFSDGGLATIENPSHTFPTDIVGNYTIQLIVSTAFGCADTAFQLVEVKENIIYYVPNTFTPDGDEHNNTFKPAITAGIDVNDYVLKIFNRWGELIFESYDVAYGWDGTYNGKIVQDGTFVWQLQFGLFDSDKDLRFQGHVTLIR